MQESTARNWIDGEWLTIGATEAESLNPANRMALGSFEPADAAVVRAAIDAAKNSLDHSDWSHQPRMRSTVLLEFADRIEAELPELAGLLTAENGKLIGEARGEVAAAVSELRYYAGLARNIFGRNTEIEPGLFATLTREPMGVAGIIVPWNAPAILLARALAPAMAAGCTSVVKTAPQTALFSERLFRLLSEVQNLPRGVVNQFTENGSDGARALVESPIVDVLSYTGSTETGKQIMQAASTTLKRLNLELGGSAPCLVFDDADLATSAAALARAGMAMAGQHCCSATRVLVHDSILDQAQEAFTSALRSIKVGPGEDPDSGMGPMIDDAAQTRVLDLLQRAGANGELLCGGDAPGGDLEQGFFINPTLVHAPDPSSPVYDGELFGPALVLDGFADEDEAVAKANASRFGLAGSIWSRDLRRSQRVANRLQIGTVWINSHLRTFPEIETGGYRESGIGRLHGWEGLDEFLQTKHISWSTEW